MKNQPAGTIASLPIGIEAPVRIWLNPSKFWVATRGMEPEQRKLLLDHLDRLAENNDLHALKQFGFVTLYKPKMAA